MKLTIIAAAAALTLGGGYAVADTASSNKDQATMEQNASPSNPTKHDEERTEAHSQPDAPASTGSSGASASDKPTHGDYYKSQENKADSSAQPDSNPGTVDGKLPPGRATLPRSVR